MYGVAWKHFPGISLTSVSSLLPTHCTQPWIIQKMGFSPETLTGDVLIGLPCLRKPRNRKRWVRAATESRLRKPVPLNRTLSDLVVHSTFLAHEVSWKCAVPPPCSMCSHRDKDESQHLAVGCTSCLKHHLCKLGRDGSRLKDSVSAVFIDLPFCRLPLPSADVVHSRQSVCFIMSGAFQNESAGAGEGHRL